MEMPERGTLDWGLMVAGRIWCDQEMCSEQMDSVAAEKIARILMRSVGAQPDLPEKIFRIGQLGRGDLTYIPWDTIYEAEPDEVLFDAQGCKVYVEYYDSYEGSGLTYDHGDNVFTTRSDAEAAIARLNREMIVKGYDRKYKKNNTFWARAKERLPCTTSS